MHHLIYQRGAMYGVLEFPEQRSSGFIGWSAPDVSQPAHKREPAAAKFDAIDLPSQRMRSPVVARGCAL